MEAGMPAANVVEGLGERRARWQLGAYLPVDDAERIVFLAQLLLSRRMSARGQVAQLIDHGPVDPTQCIGDGIHGNPLFWKLPITRTPEQAKSVRNLG